MNNAEFYFANLPGIVGAATGLIALAISIMAYRFQSQQSTTDRRVVLRQVHARLMVALADAVDNAASAMTATQTAFSVAGMVDSPMAALSAQRVKEEIRILEAHIQLLQKVDPHNDPMSNLLIEDCLVDYASVEENLRLVVARHNEIILRASEEVRLRNAAV